MVQYKGAATLRSSSSSTTTSSAPATTPAHDIHSEQPQTDSNNTDRAVYVSNDNRLPLSQRIHTNTNTNTNTNTSTQITDPYHVSDDDVRQQQVGREHIHITGTADTPISRRMLDGDDGYASSSRRSRNNYWFQVGDVVDVLDSTGHWCEAEIRKVDYLERRVYVSYLYWGDQFDEWIHNIDKIARFHEHTYHNGGVLKVGQRVDALDDQDRWLQSYVIDASADEVKIHYHNYHPKFDEWIPRNSKRIKPFVRNPNKALVTTKRWRVPGYQVAPGESSVDAVNRQNRHSSKNNSSGIGDENKEPDVARSSDRNVKLRSENQPQHNLYGSEYSAPGQDDMDVEYAAQAPVDDDRVRRIAKMSTQYKYYTAALESLSLEVLPVPGDGNCLFRSVAHQVYGDHELHWLVRQRCMDYMEADAEFFSQFIEGGMETFPRYIEAKRMNACWGDDPEIQAMCEIYGRPADIWIYDQEHGAKKLRTFHEAAASSLTSAAVAPPIRLSYYGGGHYDSIVHRQEFPRALLTVVPGTAEDQAMQRLHHRLQAPSARMAAAHLQSSTPAYSADHQDLEEADRRALEEAIRLSRGDLAWAQEDLDSCLVLSMAGPQLQGAKARSSTFDEREESKSTDTVLPANDGTSNGNSHSNSHQQAPNTDASDTVATQARLLQEVAAASEREYLDRAILSSLTEESFVTEDQLLEQALQESKREQMLALSAAAGSANHHGTIDNGESNLSVQLGGSDADLELALRISQMSEEEALQLALRQSLQNDNSAPSAASSSSSAAAATIVPTAMSMEYFEMTEDEQLEAAMKASLGAASRISNTSTSSATSQQQPAIVAGTGSTLIDEDEELMRAIAESLK